MIALFTVLACAATVLCGAAFKTHMCGDCSGATALVGKVQRIEYQLEDTEWAPIESFKIWKSKILYRVHLHDVEKRPFTKAVVRYMVDDALFDASRCVATFQQMFKEGERYLFPNVKVSGSAETDFIMSPGCSATAVSSPCVGARGCYNPWRDKANPKPDEQLIAQGFRNKDIPGLRPVCESCKSDEICVADDVCIYDNRESYTIDRIVPTRSLGDRWPWGTTRTVSVTLTCKDLAVCPTKLNVYIGHFVRAGKEAQTDCYSARADAYLLADASTRYTRAAALKNIGQIELVQGTQTASFEATMDASGLDCMPKDPQVSDLGMTLIVTTETLKTGEIAMLQSIPYESKFDMFSPGCHDEQNTKFGSCLGSSNDCTGEIITSNQCETCCATIPTTEARGFFDKIVGYLNDPAIVFDKFNNKGAQVDYNEVNSGTQFEITWTAFDSKLPSECVKQSMKMELRTNQDVDNSVAATAFPEEPREIDLGAVDMDAEKLLIRAPTLVGENFDAMFQLVAVFESSDSTVSCEYHGPKLVIRKTYCDASQDASVPAQGVCSENCAALNFKDSNDQCGVPGAKCCLFSKHLTSNPGFKDGGGLEASAQHMQLSLPTIVMAMTLAYFA